jgi:3'-phosphoadenosine 5'-phosphosulfate sulfotransferase (PAPS reductase)/FAD synthetase
MPCSEEVMSHGEVAGPGGRQRRLALSRRDLLHGQLASFRRLVERTLDEIERAARIGPIGVSFSGGKDSTVMLHLVRRVVPDAPAGFFDSGAELSDTYEFVRSTPVVEVIKVEPGLLQMCRIGGYWGYSGPETTGKVFDFTRRLVYEPAREFTRRNDLAVQAIGLRAEESAGRTFTARAQGVLHHSRQMGIYHLRPLLWWTADDVWAYIATRELPYNRAYDRMAEMSMRRSEMRICCVLGAVAASWGRYAYLRRIDPGLWNRLAAEFPLVRKYA